MKTVAYKSLPKVAALPTPVAGLEGVTVELTTDKKPYYCDGATWVDLSASSGGAGAAWSSTSLDFGLIPQGSGIFTLLDASATTTSDIIAEYAPTDDSAAFDSLSIVARCLTNGTITFFAQALPGPVSGVQPIKYLIGSPSGGVGVQMGVKDHGTLLGVPATLNFAGAGVVLSQVGQDVIATFGGNKLLQVLSVTKRDIFTSTSTSFVDITGLSLAITPTYAGSQIVAIAHTTCANTAIGSLTFLRIERTGNAFIGSGDAAGVRVRAGASYRVVSDANHIATSAMSVVDSPNTTSPVTYKVTGCAESGTWKINTTGNDLDHAVAGIRAISTLTLMEIAP